MSYLKIRLAQLANETNIPISEIRVPIEVAIQAYEYLTETDLEDTINDLLHEWERRGFEKRSFCG